MKKKVILLMGIVGGIVSTLVGCLGAKTSANPSPEFVFTYAENQAKDYPTTQGAFKFAELVYERTDGRIEILVQPGGVLGDEKSVIQQMQFGGVNFARVAISTLSEVMPKLNVLQLPYLYRDSAHMWNVLDGQIGDDFLNSFKGSTLIALSWYDAGARNFYTTDRQIKTLEDMNGLKIRVQESSLMVSMIRALGAEPRQTVYSEVYSALQTGAIEGAENNWPSFESARHYEVAKYYTIDEHNRVPELQIVSEITWNKLSEEDRKIIEECARESALYQRQLWAEREKTSREKVEASGVIVYELPEEEKARFREAVSPMYETFAREHLDIIKEIIDTP
jgi:tripartite ATP-independent transporter DctP family solute receptor